MAWLALFLAAIAIYLMVKLYKQRFFFRQQSQELHRLQDEKRAILDLLHDLGEAFTETIRSEDLMRIVVNCAIKITGASGGALYELDAQQEHLHVAAMGGIFAPLVPIPIEIEGKLASRAEYLREFIRSEPLPARLALADDLLKRGRLMIRHAEADDRLPQAHEKALQINTLLAVSLHYRNENYGVLILTNKEDGSSFKKSDLDILESIGAQAAYAIHNARVFAQLAEKKRLDRDIEVAREIQNILLPSSCPALAGYEIRAVNLPAREVSGDYFDYILLDSGRLGIAIADVSGKGVPASLLMAMCRTVLRSKAVGKTSAAETLRLVNRHLYPDIQEDMFITMTYAILDPAEKKITLARAGHEAPLYFHADHVESIRSPGMALGIDSGEVFDTVITDFVLPLSAGDAIVFYTDGVTEAIDVAGKEFGKESLKEAVEVSASRGANAIIANVVERLERFRNAADKYDDITMIAIYAKK